MPSHSTRARRATSQPPGAVSPAWHTGWGLAGGLAATVLLLSLCTKPIGDSDLWFHMAYARQMLANGTLVLDHTSFSWTPADNVIIYCAWLTQLALFGVHQLGGMPALFLLRYVMFLVVLGAVVSYARHLGAARHPLTWFLTIVALLMSSAALVIKPNMASYGFMSATVLLWFWIRHRGEQAWRWAYLLPVLMVLWVNSHGGFVMGMAYLAVATIGEILNVRFSPGMALPPVLRRHLLRAVALCFLAIFITPYGWHYPWQFLVVDLPSADLLAVREYDSIFAPNQRGMRYVEYGAIAAVILAGLSISRLRRSRVEWGLLLVNLVFAGLYVYLARLTSFWAPVALVSGITMLADGRRWLEPHTLLRRRAIGFATLLAGVLLGAQALRAATLEPVVASWQGLGNSYWNPEEEADYIARHFAGVRIGNDYNAGGYLIWKLWPETRVFIDARYFPYRSWFHEYLGFETTTGIGALVRKYPADVWCVELVLPRTVAWFRSSPDWVPAFYGASAVVFVRRGTPLPGGRLQSGTRIGDIRNLYQALLALAFALDVRDPDGALRIVTGMERRFTSAGERAIVGGARAAIDGVIAHRRGDHRTAVRLLAQVATEYQGLPATLLVESALLETRRLWLADDVPGALEMARVAARFAPRGLMARYNAGIIGWWLHRQTPGSREELWRADLEAVVSMPTADDPALRAAVARARALLEGRSSGRPPVLAPAVLLPPSSPWP